MMSQQINLFRGILVIGMGVWLQVGCNSQSPRVPSDLDIMQIRRIKHQALRSCRQCHAKRSSYRAKKFRKPIPELCYDCHDDYRILNKPLHGPVAVGACLFCHRPHVSSYIHLQRVSQPSLCTRCHEMKDDTISKIHQGASDQLCTQCHDPHAGSNPMFLKE
jgi:predicted CXXCH cytochrome family protein